MACVNKSNPQPMPFGVNPQTHTFTFPEGSSRVSTEQCEATCADNVCCNGPSCVPGCRCLPELGGFIVNEEACDPNPCCPGCSPPTLQDPSGKCCRATYVDDGSGACCPRDCCASGGDNGKCCPEDQPYCCKTGRNNDPGGTSACQSSIPTPCPGISDHFLRPCADASTETAGREMSFSVEPGQFTAQVTVNGSRLNFGQAAVHYADPENIFVNYGGGEVAYPGGAFQFCKPAGVSTVTVRIGQVRTYLGCGVNDQAGVITPPQCDCLEFVKPDGSTVFNSAWAVDFICLSGCECEENPLP